MMALKEYLLEERKEWFARSLVKRLSIYAAGRSLDIGDRDEIVALTEQFINHGYRLRPLLVDLAQSSLLIPR